MKPVKELVNGTQLDLFELLAVCAASKPAKVKKKRMKVVRDSDSAPADDDDYLKRGERIETLARDRFAKVIEGLTFSSLEEKVYGIPYNQAENLYCHVDKVAKVLRAFVSKMDLSKDSEDYKTLVGLIDFDIEIEPVDYSASSYIGAVRRLRYKGKKSTDQLHLTVRENGWPDMHIYGYRSLSVGKETWLMTDHTCAADIGMILAWLFIFTLYNRAIKSEDMLNGVLTEAFDLWKPTGPENYGDLLTAIFRYDGYFWLKESAEGRNLTASEIFGSEINRQKTKLVQPHKEYMRPRDEVLDEFKRLFNLQDVNIPVSSLKHTLLTEKNREAFNASNGTEICQWELPYGIEYGIVSLDPVSYFKKGFGAISYNRTLSRAQQRDTGEAEYVPPAWAKPNTSQSHTLDSAYELIKTVVKAVWAEKGQIVSKLRYFKDMESGKSVAKAYQTKKDIPLKVLREMEKSEFNKYFGYVEIDESCDLDKVRAIAEEFSIFKEEVLPGVDSREVSLRFRRIGNHKALGLYYPMLGCLVVDVTSPSSFIHEYGHCLDNILGDYPLSDMSGFYKTYSIYKECLMESLRSDMAEYKRIYESKSKYNLSYYLLHTEAFARCFEIYVARVLGLNTSLCKMDEKLGWAYPKSERLTESIKEYFDSLLATVNSVAQETADAA